MHLILFISVFSALAQTTKTDTWDAKFNFLKENNAQAINKNLTSDMTEKTEGDFDGKECLRIKDEHEGKSLYSSESFKELVIPWGNERVTITAEGCTDKVFKNAAAADFSDTSRYPDNIVLPIKSGEKVTSIGSLQEDQLSDNMQKFFDSIKTKLSGEYSIDGTKEIIIYATATKVAPTCKAPDGYDKSLLVAETNDKSHLSKSFDIQTSLSNSELAFKRSLNFAKTLKRFVLDPYATENPKVKIKIRTKCTYGTSDSSPKLEIYGMLKKFQWPAPLACGASYNLPGIVGNRTPPSYLTTDVKADFKLTEIMGANQPATGPFYQIDGDSIKYTYSVGAKEIPIANSCFAKFRNTDGNYSDDPTNKKQFEITFNNQKITVKKLRECQPIRCAETYMALKKDITKMSAYEWVHCGGITKYTTNRNYVIPGDFMVGAAGADNSLTLAKTSFKKGDRFQLLFNAVYVPDRFIVTMNKKIIIDTGFASNTPASTNQYSSRLTGLSQGSIIRDNSITNNAFDAAKGISYVFPADATNAELKLHSFGPFGTTIWNVQMNCPDQSTNVGGKSWLMQQAEAEIKKLVK